MPTLAGTQLDKYEMIEEVGCGGMAVVYRGLDRVLKREVAVKVLHSHLADRQESRLRLQREAIAVAKLRHENILEIFDYSGPEAGESYIVTEFIHGPTLREWIDGELDPRPAIAAMIVFKLALALHHAHKGGIVHRDIKPENVMIRSEDGCIKLMDFGIAQILDNQKLTMTGQLIGSPAYMAPELISGRPLDARTDLFSLGIMLYQLATGSLPFSGRNPHEVLNRIADGHYPAPSTICPLVDRDLEAIIAKSLATNPDERFQNAESLAKELEHYLGEMSIEPTAVEICAYFRDAKGYVLELDRRVSTALMQQAEKAAKDGMNARAIRLLGRVLELDSGHKAAKSMLVRLRKREKRVRQALVGGAAVAMAGIVYAGVGLMDRTRASEAEKRAGMNASAHDVAQDGGEGGVATTKLAARKDPVGVAATVGGASAGADEGDDPTVGSAAGGVEGGVAPEDSGGSETDGEKPGKKPGTGKRVPNETAPCKVTLDGIAASTAKNATFKAGGKSVKVTDLVVAFVLEGDETTVTLTHTSYLGSRRVTRAECLSGSPVHLEVRPKAAKLAFAGFPEDEVSVICKGCGPDIDGKKFLARDFPSFDLSDPEGVPVALEFKSAAYEPKTVKHTARPGSQEITPDLTPRAGDSG